MAAETTKYLLMRDECNGITVNYRYTCERPYTIAKQNTSPFSHSLTPLLILLFIFCLNCMLVHCLVFNTRVIVYRATLSAVFCLVVPVFICIYLLIVMCSEIK